MSNTKKSTAKKSPADKAPKKCKNNQSRLASADVSALSVESACEAWCRNTDRLAKFAFEQLTNRNDAYGRYLSLDRRTGKNKATTIRDGVTEEVLREHFRSAHPGNLIGLHTTSKANTCRWLVIDIDQHGEPNSELESRNERAALSFAQILADYGADPLVIKTNGQGGFHVWLIFDKPFPAAHLYTLGKIVVKDWDELKIEQPEVIPKQPHLEDDKLGNWVRLPG